MTDRWLGNGHDLRAYLFDIPAVFDTGYGGNTGYVSPDEFERYRDAYDQLAMESRHNIINGGHNA